MRAFHRAQRRRQLELLRTLRAGTAAAGGRTIEEDAVLLFTLERVCDAVANGEVRDLGLERARVLAVIRDGDRRGHRAADARANRPPKRARS